MSSEQDLQTYDVDLHAHHSFFSRGEASWHITEPTTPNLGQIIWQARKRDLDLVAITSCSVPSHIDRRWEQYLQELRQSGEVRGSSRQARDIVSSVPARLIGVELNPQAMEIHFGSLADCLATRTDRPLYMVHGQEFKTHRGDINVLFAETRIPVEHSGGNFDWLVRAARDSGEHVIVTIPHPARGCTLTPKELRGLYEFGMIDAIEAHDALDTVPKNLRSRKWADAADIPGIAVSDSHRLCDTGIAYTRLNMPRGPYDFRGLAKEVKEAIRTHEFDSFEGRSPTTSRLLYSLRLANAIVWHKLHK